MRSLLVFRVASSLSIFFLLSQLQAQPTLLGFRSQNKDSNFFFRPDGTEAFKLSANFYFVDWIDQADNAGPMGYINQRKQLFMEFQQFPIVLKSDGIGFILVDERGQITDTLGYDYTEMGQFSGKYAPARINRRAQGMPFVVFIDKNGKRAFNDQVFYRVTPFYNGQAAVQTEGPEGPWFMIDEQGKKTTSFPKKLASNVAEIFPLRNNRQLVVIKQPKGYDHDELLTRHQYYNAKGNLELELRSLFPEKNILYASEFDGDIAHAVYQEAGKEDCSGVVYFDTEGKVLYDNPCVLRASAFHNNAAYISQTDSSGRDYTLVLRRDGSTQPLEIGGSKNKALAIDAEKGRYQAFQPETDGKFKNMLTDGTVGMFIYRKENPEPFAKAAEFGTNIQMQEWLADDLLADQVLREQDGLKEVFRTPKFVLTSFGNTVLLGGLMNDGMVHPDELVHLDGRLLWSDIKNDKFYLGMEEALRHASKVRTLTLNDDDGIEGIQKLPNLEEINIRHVRAEELPQSLFSNNPKLQTVTLLDAKNLKNVPSLFNIQTFGIQGATQMKGMEAAVKAAKNLKTLRIVDSALFNDAFLQEMKSTRSGLKIRFSFMEYEVMEEAPAPRKN
ncbi:MAG: hypothetical protein IPL65_08970 [Lewinellaceae bacterium]|nr:hypothetical protein [Lewinellaceae bacterium]